jgi:phenylacetate-CoA ligase
MKDQDGPATIPLRGWRIRVWQHIRRETFREFYRSAAHGRAAGSAIGAADVQIRLRAVIADAARNIPFYRDHWAGRGVLAAAEAGDVELGDLPTLSRDDLREGYELLRNPTVPAKDVVERATGGSTGHPIRFAQSRSYLERATGRSFRCLTWGGWKVGARTAMVWGGPTELRLSEGVRGWIKAVITNRRVYDAFRTGEKTYAAWLEAWRRWKPQFVIGYASALDGFAAHLLEHGDRLAGIAAVFSTAEKLYPRQRARIEEAFGAPVRDQYGSREVLAVAGQCVHGSMHAYLDSAYLELQPQSGGVSAVTLTQLDNPAMPLIRYVNGDLARWREPSAPCPCGLRYPILEEVVGRVSDLFRLSDGRIVHGEYFTHIMYDVPHVRAFQFYQGPDGSITLFVEPTQENAVRELEQLLQSALVRVQSELRLPSPVRLRMVSEIPKRGQGKYRFTVSEYVGRV